MLHHSIFFFSFWSLLINHPFFNFNLKFYLLCEDVYVLTSATVGDLKVAIETAFSHVPKKGPSKISWYIFQLLLHFYLLLCLLKIWPKSF